MSTLGSLWPSLAEGGLYVIEDIGDSWRHALQADRKALVGIIGPTAPYFFVDAFCLQTETTAIPLSQPNGLSMLVITKPRLA